LIPTVRKRQLVGQGFRAASAFRQLGAAFFLECRNAAWFEIVIRNLGSKSGLEIDDRERSGNANWLIFSGTCWQEPSSHRGSSKPDTGYRAF
jgi:hypothetical protein